jgi:hypothetical protein
MLPRRSHTPLPVLQLSSETTSDVPTVSASFSIFLQDRKSDESTQSTPLDKTTSSVVSSTFSLMASPLESPSKLRSQHKHPYK